MACGVWFYFQSKHARAAVIMWASKAHRRLHDQTCTGNVTVLSPIHSWKYISASSDAGLFDPLLPSSSGDCVLWEGHGNSHTKWWGWGRFLPAASALPTSCPGVLPAPGPWSVVAGFHVPHPSMSELKLGSHLGSRRERIDPTLTQQIVYFRPRTGSTPLPGTSYLYRLELFQLEVPNPTQIVVSKKGEFFVLFK